MAESVRVNKEEIERSVEAVNPIALFQPTDPNVEWKQLAEHYRSRGSLNPGAEVVIDAVIEAHLAYHAKPFFNFFKRALDICLALGLIILFSPVFIAAALMIKLTTKGPVFFLQIRIGHRWKPFWILKFRTMRLGSSRVTYMGDNEMRNGLFKITNDPRITRIGKFLRRWSIDELPQLFNVLIGDMSIVGPRPMTAEDTATVRKQHYARFAAKPGITGLWQATTRDSNNGQVKIALDAEYATNRSFTLDLKLILKTIPAVLKGTGAV